MEYLMIKKSNIRDTVTLADLGMLAYRIFPDSECINIQLLSGAQEESTIPFKDGERFRLRNSELCLIIVD